MWDCSALCLNSSRCGCPNLHLFQSRHGRCAWTMHACCCWSTLHAVSSRVVLPFDVLWSVYQILALESDVVAAMESLREHTTALTMGTIGSVCAAASDDSNADADGGGCGVQHVCVVLALCDRHCGCVWHVPQPPPSRKSLMRCVSCLKTCRCCGQCPCLHCLPASFILTRVSHSSCQPRPPAHPQAWWALARRRHEAASWRWRLAQSTCSCARRALWRPWTAKASSWLMPPQAVPCSKRCAVAVFGDYSTLLYDCYCCYCCSSCSCVTHTSPHMLSVVALRSVLLRRVLRWNRC